MLKRFARLILKDEIEAAASIIRKSDDTIADLRRDLRMKDFEIAAEQKRSRKAIRIIDATTDDPDPSDQNERERYVSQVSLFMIDIGEKKILHIIAQIRELMDSVTMPENFPFSVTRNEYDWYLKGSSNFAKVFLDWGDEMRREHQANVLNSNP